MENASKAIIIAGSILIALSILVIWVYSATQIESTAEPFINYKQETEIMKYNANFECLIRNENEFIAAQEILTAINVSQENNGYTRIYVDDIDVTEYNLDNTDNNTKDEKINFLEENIFKYTYNQNKKNINNYFLYVPNSAKYNQIGKIVEIRFINKK